MKIAPQTVVAGWVGLLLGIVATVLVLPMVRPVIEYYRPPRVTVMNATGGDIFDITVGPSVDVKRPSSVVRMADLKDGQARTVRLTTQFSESSTHVSWSDSTGRHEGRADDYIEGCGLYHSRVVLTPDRKVKAIFEVTTE